MSVISAGNISGEYQRGTSVGVKNIRVRSKIWGTGIKNLKKSDSGMICELPDPQPLHGKRVRSETTQQFFSPRKRRRVGIGAPRVPQVVRDGAKEVAVSLVKTEIRDSLKSAVFQGLEKSFSEEAKQKRMAVELEKSKALPSLLSSYLSVVDDAPQIMQILW